MGSLSAFQLTGPDPDSSIDRKDKDLTLHNPGKKSGDNWQECEISEVFLVR